MTKKINPYRIYLIYSGFSAFLFSLVFTVSSIYYIESVGLNPFQLVIVGTVLELSYFLFEIPTGVVADVYSRRLSIIIGLFLIGIGFIFAGVLPLFIAVIISQILWGIGATFTSGADVAWIADELKEDDLQRVLINCTQINQLCALVGVILSVLLGSVSLNLPILLGGVFFIALMVFLIIFMPENGFHPVKREEQGSWDKLMDTLRTGIDYIRKSRILISMLIIALFYGLYSEGIDRLWNAHFLENFSFPTFWSLEPIIWFGIINTVAMLINILILSRIKKKLIETGKQQRVWLLIGINALLIISIFIFGGARSFATALIAFWTLKILRTVNGPIYRAFINQHVSSNVRATVISTLGQCDSLGQILAGPIIGYIALKSSISIAIIVSGFLLLPVVFLYLANRE